MIYHQMAWKGTAFKNFTQPSTRQVTGCLLKWIFERKVYNRDADYLRNRWEHLQQRSICLILKSEFIQI